MSDPNHLSTRDRNSEESAADVVPSAVSEVVSDTAADTASASNTQDAAVAANSADAPDVKSTQETRNIVPISFDGTAKQYFKLFTVNLLLTIITLGIYSAWARIRTRRFFSGNTYIGKHNLEFDAHPVSILVSRILVVIVLGGLLFAEIRFEFIWSGVGIFLVGVLLLMPFALVRGRSFIARHTIHRTVRFRYRLAYRRPVILYLGYAFFAILITYTATLVTTTLVTTTEDTTYWTPFFASLVGAALAYPLLIHFDHRIQIDQLLLGKLPFSYEGRIGPYYRGMMKASLWSIGISIVVTAAIFIIDYIVTLLIRADPGSELLVGAVIAVLSTLLYVVCMAPYRSILTCLYWRSFRIGEDSAIESRLEWLPYARLLIDNYILIILSLGLMYPWARVRAYRHVAERLRVRLGPATAAAYFSSSDDLTPLAGEFADVAGWDVDFGAI
ncbi:YjgN family protein [Thioalkalivibrio sp. HK1]|uniref:YjgN family protein n=1 Tax=Thioalkalivibrio sp. HK1 TaxID=1469245 RepID=UPI000470051C|nr:DUF898 family protein [Thioalkalivibrio sp. HK1]